MPLNPIDLKFPTIYRTGLLSAHPVAGELYKVRIRILTPGAHKYQAQVIAMESILASPTRELTFGRHI